MAVTAATQCSLVALRSFPPRVLSSLSGERCLISKQEIRLVAVLALVVRLDTSIAGRLGLVTLECVSERRLSCVTGVMSGDNRRQIAVRGDSDLL